MKSYSCTWMANGHQYRLSVEDEGREDVWAYKCCVSEHTTDFWHEEFYSNFPEHDANRIIEERNVENEEVFRTACFRYGAEVVRLVRQEFGDEYAKIIIEGKQLYILDTQSMYEIRRYYAFEYEHEVGHVPSKDDLDDYIEFNYYLIPCSKGCIVIHSDYMW